MTLQQESLILCSYARHGLNTMRENPRKPQTNLTIKNVQEKK